METITNRATGGSTVEIESVRCFCPPTRLSQGSIRSAPVGDR